MTREVTPAELKRNLFEQLKESGALLGLKSQLRTQLLDRLAKGDASFVRQRTGTQGTFERVFNSLVAEYLKERGYAFTLSVFQPECGAHTSAPILTRDEVVRLLGLDAPSPIGRFLATAPATATPPAPLAIQLLQALSENASTAARHDSGTQTAEATEASLALQLQQLEDIYLRRVQAERANPLWSAEDRMAAFRKECEERLKVEVELQVQRVRELEVSSIRLQESARYRRLMDVERQEADRQYLERMNRLKEREERMHEKFRRLQLELDARDHQLRGQVAAEEDRLQQARHTADREAEQRDAVLRDKEDRLRRHEEILADRQREIDRLRAALVSETDKARDQARMEMWEELSTQREQLRADRLSLEKDKARLAEQREEFSDQLLRARSLAEKLRASESLRVEADARAAALAAAEEPMRAHMARVEEDNKQLRQALASAVNQQAAQQIQLRGAVQPEVDRARQDAVEARQEVQALRHKLGRYRDALDEAEEAVALLETNDAARLQQIHRLERLLEDAVRARDETLARFEDARLAVAEAQREVADTRARNAHLAKKLQAQGAAVGGAASFEGLGFGAGGLGLGFAAAPVMAEERLALAAPRLFALEPEGQFPAAHEDAQMEARLTALAQEEDRLRQDLVEFRRRIVGGLEEDPSEGMAVAAPRDSRAAAGRRAAGKADARRPHFYGSEGEGETESSSSSSSSAAEERRAKKKKRSKRGKKEEKSVPAAPAAVIDPAAASNSAMLALAQILQGLQGSMQPQRGPVNQETAAPIPASAPAAPVTLSPRARSPEAEAAPVPAVLSPRHSASPSPVPDLPPPRTSPPVASPSPTPTPSIENPTAASPPREPAAVLPGRAVGSLLGLDATPSLSSVAEGEVTLAGGSNASDSRSTAPEEPAPAPATAPVSSSTPQLSPRSLVEAAEAAGPSASLVFQQDISAVLGGGSRRQSFGDDTLDLPSMALTAADLASPARPRGILEDTPDHDHDDDIVDRTERSPASPRGGAGGESESDAVDLGIEGDLPLPASLPPSEAASDRDRRDAFAVDPYDDLSQFRQIDDLLGGSEGSGISVPGLKGDRSNGSLDVPKSEGSGSVF